MHIPRISHGISFLKYPPTIFQNIQSTLEEPWYYWSPFMAWLTLGSYLLINEQNSYLKQTLLNINVRCLSIISMHHMDKNICIILCWWLCLLVYKWIYWKMICGYFREDISCELLGICTLVNVNKDFSDERSFHFCGSD